MPKAPERDIALIDDLRALPSDTSWVEFKANNTAPDMVGKRCSALAIGAQGHSLIRWGST